MPFEKVKNIVVAETSKEGIALDEKAKLEVSNIKTKLDQYKKKTENYIDSLSYPGKEDDKKQYVDDLRESLGEILKDNNATQQEMALYSRNVNERSEKLKKKLETEMAKIELKQVEQWMSSHFGEKFDISDNITTYFSVPEGQRIPLAKIKKEMTALLSAATSNMPSNEYRENKSSFYAILNHYCWGDAEAAKKETALVREKIKFFIKCRDIEKRTGITMGHDDFEILMTGLINVGLANKDNVHSVLEKNINQLKNLNKGDFKRLAENVRGEALANLLFAAILSLNKKGNAETIGGIKMIMAIESRVAENAKAINKTLADNQKKLGKATRDLKKLGSDVVIDEDIAGFKKEIAEAICGIEECKRDFLLNSAKKSLANRYLAQESSNPANKNVQNTVNLILNAKETDELNNLSLDKCNIGNIPELPLLRASQLRIDLSVNDVAVKIWFSQNQSIDGVSLHDVLNKFYKTGEVTERSKGAFEAKLKIEGANLGEIIKENVEHEKAFAKTFKETVEKYGSIEKVPEEELSSVAGQLAGYAEFLRTMQKTNEKYTANREESFAIFGSKSALLKSEIDTGKTRNVYILSQICSVSKFMKIEENLKSTIEQNEKAEKDFDKYFKDIEGKYGSLDKIPAEEKEKVVKKLNEYIEALKTSCLTRISYISRKEDTLGTLPPHDSSATILKMEIWGESEKIRSAEHKIAEVSKFLGIRLEKGEAENPDKLESPLFAPIIQNEINPYMQSINSYGEKIQIAAQPLSGTPSLIERNIQSATWQNSKAGLAAFQEGINHTIDFARLLEEARANMENIKNQILSSIKDPAKIKGMPESMRLQREQYLRSVVENINAELKKRYHASPLSKDSISQIKEYTNHLASQKKKYLLGKFVTGVIFTVSIASAVAGGWALGGLARTVFGLAPKVGTKFTSLAIGSKVSNFAIGAFSMSGVSLGSVVGSRLAMESLDTFGIADFGGHEAIWASGKRDEFVYGFGISLGAVLVARGIIGGLSAAATSKTLAENLPKLSKLSQWGLKGMKGLATFANPGEWFKSKQGGLLKSFVAETGEESVQEGMESAAGKIGGRWAEFGASVLSASGGRKIDLQVHGINPSDINVDFKGNAMVYNGPNVQQFVSNLESNLAGRRNLLYKTTINPNGVVTLEIGKFYIDKKTGGPVQTTFKKFNIYPGQEAETAGIEGLEKVKGKESVYTVKTSEDAIRILGDFKNRGFNIVRKGENAFRISKGPNEFIVEMSAEVANSDKSKVSPQQMKLMEILGLRQTAFSLREEAVSESEDTLKDLVKSLKYPSFNRGNPTELILKLTESELPYFLGTYDIREALLDHLDKREKDYSKIKKVFDKLKSQDPKLENDYLDIKKKKLIQMADNGLHAYYWTISLEIKAVFKDFQNPVSLNLGKEDVPKIIGSFIGYEDNISIDVIKIMHQKFLEAGVTKKEFTKILKTALDSRLKYVLEYKDPHYHHCSFQALNGVVNSILNFSRVAGIDKSKFADQLRSAAIELKESNNPYLAAILVEEFDMQDLKGDLLTDPFADSNPDIEKIQFMGEALTAFEKISITERHEMTSEQIQQKMLSLMDKKTSYGLTLKQRKLIDDMIIKYKKDQSEFSKIQKLSKPELQLWVKNFFKKEAGIIIRDFDFNIEFQETIESGPRIMIHVPKEVIAQTSEGVQDMNTLSASRREEVLEKNSWVGGINFGTFASLVLDKSSKIEKTSLHEATHYVTSFLGITPRYKKLYEKENDSPFDLIRTRYQAKLQEIGDEIISYTKDGSLAKEGEQILFYKLKEHYFEDVLYYKAHLGSEDIATVEKFKKRLQQDFEVAVITAIRNAAEISAHPNGFNMMRITNITQWGKLSKHIKGQGKKIRSRKQ